MPDDNEKFFNEEAREIMRGELVLVSAHELTVGALRNILKTAVLKNVTGIEITDTGHAVPFRISVRQLRGMVEQSLKDAPDDRKLDLALPPVPGQTLH